MSSQSFCIFVEFSLDFFLFLRHTFQCCCHQEVRLLSAFGAGNVMTNHFRERYRRQANKARKYHQQEAERKTTSFSLLLQCFSTSSLTTKKSNYGKLSYNKRQLTCDRILLFRTFFPFCSFSKEVQKISDYFVEQYSRAQLGEINYGQVFN